MLPNERAVHSVPALHLTGPECSPMVSPVYRAKPPRSAKVSRAVRSDRGTFFAGARSRAAPDGANVSFNPAYLSGELVGTMIGFVERVVVAARLDDVERYSSVVVHHRADTGKPS